jgi:hypothetical protein
MPTKQELHKLIDQLSDEPSTSELRALYRAITEAMAVVSGPDQDDTTTLVGLSSSALLRDWDSDADSIYDDEPA